MRGYGDDGRRVARPERRARVVSLHGGARPRGVGGRCLSTLASRARPPQSSGVRAPPPRLRRRPRAAEDDAVEICGLPAGGLELRRRGPREAAAVGCQPGDRAVVVRPVPHAWPRRVPVAAAGEVGIDVESADRLAEPKNLATRFFSPDEVERLQACAPAEQRVRFTELWTLKEAFLKALGVGLAMPLGAMSFDLRDSGSIRFTPPPDVAPARWHFACSPPPNGTSSPLPSGATPPSHRSQ